MVNRKALVPYCGGAPGLGPSSPVSPGGGRGRGDAFPSPDASLTGGGPPEAARALVGGALWGACAPPALVGGAPRSPTGPWPDAPRFPRGPDASAPRPEEELDGCEPEDADPPPSPAPDPAPAPPEDPLRRATLALVGRYLREAAGLKGAAEDGPGAGAKLLLLGLWDRLGAPAAPPAPQVGRALDTLRRVGGSILDKHQLAFQGMLRKMEIKNESDLKTVSEVAKFVFDDGITNWGRIATLISFGAFVAQHLKSIDQEGCINTLAEIITDVLVTDKRDWLVEHDAWEGFVKFFHVEDVEGSVRSILMAFAGVAGLGASLAYMIR